MKNSKNQRAKSLYSKMICLGFITSDTTGLVGNSVWVSRKYKAYKIEDISMLHLINIKMRYISKSEEVPYVIQKELEKRKKCILEHA